MDTFVTRKDVEVLRRRADLAGKGPAEAFRELEAKLPTLQGRKFYGTIRILPGGPEEYFACVERTADEDPVAMGLELATIPGGLYVRRKIADWERVIAEGRLPSIGAEMSRTYHLDPSRPELEYYRSARELHLLLPVLDRTVGPGDRPPRRAPSD